MSKLKDILSDANSRHIAFMLNDDTSYCGVKLLESLMYTGVIILNDEYLANADFSEFENE